MNERQRAIKLHLDSHGEVNLAQLVGMFPKVSEMTLRRDLIALENEGLLKRTKGGAVALHSVRQLSGGGDLHLARLLLSMLEKGRTVYLDAGAPTLALARLMGEGHSIITPSPEIAAELLHHAGCGITMVGGYIAPGQLGCSGMQSMEEVRALNIDTAVIVPEGFTLRDGFTCAQSSAGLLRRQAIYQAQRVLCALPKERCGRVLPHTFAHLADADALVCDAFPGDAIARAAEESAVEVVF